MPEAEDPPAVQVTGIGQPCGCTSEDVFYLHCPGMKYKTIILLWFCMLVKPDL
jgi:hypothetical protein